MPEQDISSDQPKVRLPGLDPEAIPVIGLGLGMAGLLLGLRPRLAAWPLALTALAALLYRNPDRETPSSADSLIAPADGVVLVVDERYEHRFLHTDARRLLVDVSPLEVPVQRSPLSGTVEYLEHVSGEERPLWALRAADTKHSERQYIGIAAEWGRALLVITAGPLARHIACPLRVGQHVSAGERITTVRLGAYVELLLPRDIVTHLPVPGARLQAGLTPVGRLVPL
jgi:phosphatidylserine decarboxylase